MPVIEDNEKIAFDAGDQSGRIEFALSDRSLSRIPLLPPTLDWGWRWPFIHNHSMWLSLLLLLVILVKRMSLASRSASPFRGEQLNQRRRISVVAQLLVQLVVRPNLIFF